MTRMKTSATRRNNADLKEKGKLKEDSFISSKNKRRQFKRSFTSRRQRNVANPKLRQVWKRKGSDGITVESGQPRIHPWRSRSGDAKLVRSPHVWQNNFVSNKSSFFGYCFACKRYGHREEESRKRSRRNNLGCHRYHAYGHNVSKSRNMHIHSPDYANVICYQCNGFGHRSHECKKKNSQSYGSRWNNHAQYGSSYRVYEKQRPTGNKRRSVLEQSRNPWRPIAGYNGIIRKGRGNWYVRRSPKHLIGINVICYYNNASDHVVEFGKERSMEQKKVNITPRAVNEERKEIKKVWRKKKEDKSMDKHCVFNAQVISPKA